VLDLPEPWNVIRHAEKALRLGGIFVAYTPSITQAAKVRETLAESRAWNGARTLEVLHRGWHIEGQAVRPDHRMVAHTAFLTTARFLGVHEHAPMAEPLPEVDDLEDLTPQDDVTLDDLERPTLGE